MNEGGSIGGGGGAEDHGGGAGGSRCSTPDDGGGAGGVGARGMERDIVVVFGWKGPPSRGPRALSLCGRRGGGGRAFREF